MHGKFPAIQQNQRKSILFHETIPLMWSFTRSRIYQYYTVYRSLKNNIYLVSQSFPMNDNLKNRF
jgi:hypothetical protein